MLHKSTFALPIVAAAALFGCDNGKTEETPKAAAMPTEKAADDAGSAEAGDPSDEAPVEPAGPKADPELLSAIDGVISNCSVDAKGGSLNECKAEEFKNLRTKVKEDENSLETLAVVLGDADPNKVFVAASLMMNEFRTLGEAPEVDPVVAKALVDGFAKTSGYTAARAAPTVSMAATASGDDAVMAAMFKAADDNENENATAAAYRYAMRYGGTRAFPKIKDKAEGDAPRLAAAAVQSYREVHDASTQLSETVCPWARGLLEHEDKQVRQQAGWVAIRCGGESIDRLLEVGEERLENHEFSRDDYMVYRDICFSFMGEDTAGSEEQCNRNYAFLQKAVDDSKLESSDRSLALFAIYYQRRDDATKKLAKKYAKSKDPEIKERANEILESLNK